MSHQPFSLGVTYICGKHKESYPRGYILTQVMLRNNVSRVRHNGKRFLLKECV